MPAPAGDQTGDARFREGWGGRLVLQVAYKIDRDEALGGPIVRWRDATRRDLYRVRHMRKARQLEPLL